MGGGVQINSSTLLYRQEVCAWSLRLRQKVSAVHNPLPLKNAGSGGRGGGGLPPEGPVSALVPPWRLQLLCFPQLQAPSAATSPKMATMLLLLSALLGLFSPAEGQTFHLGKCPTPPVQENFDVTKVW